MKPIAMLDLSAEWAWYGEAVRQAIDEVLRSAQFVNGPAVAQLEQTLARRVGVADAVAVGSGTDALLCTLMALSISRGDEVILPTFTFFATAGVVHRLGATPVFVDIDPRTFNLDPDGVKRAITDRTKAIIAVHLFGQCAAMDAIRDVASCHGLTVIEDAAQAIGATDHGRPACSLGDVACLSFYPTKNLGGCGEGGMILTDREPIARLARSLRNHGASQPYRHDRVGGNFRLDTLQAAAVLAKLPYLDDLLHRRRTHAAHYQTLLAGLPVTTPWVAEGQQHAYHQYSILCDRRDALAAHLRRRGVATGLYYPVPLHRQPCFAALGYAQGACPVAEEVCERILSLPCHPMLEPEDVDRVASSIREFYEKDSPEVEPSGSREASQALRGLGRS